nr:T9SS type A sorting domain-containing protein [Candidatus Poribacteria bacterium]
ATTALASQLVQVALGSLTQAEALTNTGSAVAVYALQILGTMGITVDDSDHDFNGVNGRLVFQIDNVCVPIFSTQRVKPWFDYVGGASIESDESLIPNKFALFDNYPNPFNPTTQIAVDLPEAAFTELTVWNIMGQKVVTLHSGELNAGRHSISFDGRDTNGKQLTSGMYIYRVKAGKYNAAKKMTLMK